jgi:hypothetical protein
MEMDVGYCEAQKNLSISDLRDIFQSIDKISMDKVDEREILKDVVDLEPEYELRFLRWLVRHTLHPETDDDIMTDEVDNFEEIIDSDGSTIMNIRFNRIPVTVDNYLLVQYQHTFWHVISVCRQTLQCKLKLLSDYVD